MGGRVNVSGMCKMGGKVKGGRDLLNTVLDEGRVGRGGYI